jgi:hypothetical protein
MELAASPHRELRWMLPRFEYRVSASIPTCDP